MHLRYAISPGTLPSAIDSSHPPDTIPSSCKYRSSLLDQASRLATQGIDFFLLREPTLKAGELAAIAREILTLLANSPTRLLLHSRPDIAIATRAHGVHLPSSHDALTPAQVRTLYASASLPAPIVSLSCHTEEDVLRVCELHPDLILFGPVFGKTIANELVIPPIGLQALRQACTLAAPIPVLALGGITEANTPASLQAGAAGIAAIRLFQIPSRP